MTSRPWEKKLRLTKAEAAEGQFRQAIRLFFEQGDPASIHTLASAANQVLSDLLATAGAGGVSRNPHIFVEERFREWINAVKRDENFLKHADKDPSATLELDTFGTVAMLIECSLMIERVTQRVSLDARVFLIWCMKAYPEYFQVEETNRQRLDHFSADNFPMIRRVLDDPSGIVSAAMQNFKPPAPATTPYDIFLNKGI